MHRERTPEDVAWAAGLFEGEGCWNAYVRPSGKVQMQVKVGMTDQDVVERLCRIMGCGTVVRSHSRAHRERGDKPLFTWSVYEAERVREVIHLLLPHMGERRTARALEVLELGANVRPHGAKKTHCPEGHALAGENLLIESIGRKGADGEVKTYEARRCRVCRRTQERNRARVAKGITPDRWRMD